MNRYGEMAMEFARKHRPAALADVADPEEHFGTVGQEIGVAVGRLRDELLLGERRPGEDLEAFRLRSYQASRTAEELVLAEHEAMVPEAAGPKDEVSDPELTRHHQATELVGEALMAAHRTLSSDDPGS